MKSEATASVELRNKLLLAAGAGMHHVTFAAAVEVVVIVVGEAIHVSVDDEGLFVWEEVATWWWCC